MDRSEALDRFGIEPRAHLATVTPDGTPHVVPVTFALVGNEIVTAIDHKPKRTRRLQRLVNVENNPQVSMITDHYSEDWDRLWWVRVDGRMDIRESEQVDGLLRDALVGKYPAYQRQPPAGPHLILQIEKVKWWGYS